MEKALVSLLNKLIEKNYDITLVLENKSGALLQLLDSKIKVREYRMSYCKISVLRKGYNFLHRLFWSFFNRNRYDFSCNFATYSIIGSKLACIASKNSAFYVHSNYSGFFNGDKAKTKEFFQSCDIEKFKHSLFVSYDSLFAAKEAFPHLSHRFEVINNIIDTEDIILKSQVEVKERFDDSKINLLFVGRLDNSSKNFELLLESFKTAYQKNSQLRLYIIGNGPDKMMLEELSKDYKDSVILMGEKVNPYPYMRMCDSLILTSRYEGYPVVYTEALILNKPFITTVPVRDDFVDIKDYFTVTEHCAESIANEILKVNKNVISYNINFDFANDERIRKIEKIIHMRSNTNEN